VSDTDTQVTTTRFSDEDCLWKIILHCKSTFSNNTVYFTSIVANRDLLMTKTDLNEIYIADTLWTWDT